ncbi:hypothetical protein L6452_38597 [Arctium lappa]|uniref:Uncharacterized protein n=1 Tax=Arctium lappa TaxID=4217 RepID=A0ACB8XQ00_ARCLA|nr:hypothetical protein L6452_38597 [Arctium lappa]
MLFLFHVLCKSIEKGLLICNYTENGQEDGVVLHKLRWTLTFLLIIKHLGSINPPIVDFHHHESAEIEDVSDSGDLYKIDHSLLRETKVTFRKLIILFLVGRQIKATATAMAVATDDGEISTCTTFEALSAFAWRDVFVCFGSAIFS